MQRISSDDQKRKKSLMFNRIFGIAISVAILALLLLYYFNSVDDWIFSIGTIMLSAINFTVCATISHTSGRDSINTANMFFSVIFFLVGLGFLIYGLVTGNLILPF